MQGIETNICAAANGFCQTCLHKEEILLNVSRGLIASSLPSVRKRQRNTALASWTRQCEQPIPCCLLTDTCPANVEDIYQRVVLNAFLHILNELKPLLLSGYASERWRTAELTSKAALCMSLDIVFTACWVIMAAAARLLK